MTYPSLNQERRRPQWFMIAFVAVASSILPLAIDASEWMPQAYRLLYVAFWAALVGIGLGSRRWPSWTLWVVGLLLGALYGLQFAGKLLPSLGLVWEDFGRAIGWLWGVLSGRGGSVQLPFERSIRFFSLQSGLLFRNLADFGQSVRNDVINLDSTGLSLAVSLAVWVLTWNAAYQLIRHRRAWAGLLPLGLAVVVNASFTAMNEHYVHVFLAITLLAVVWTRMERLEAIWKQTRLDYSTELKRDVMAAGTTIGALALVVGLIFPYVTWDDALWAFWDRVGPRLEQVYRRLDHAFAGRNPLPTPTPSGTARGLASHELGGGLPTSNDVLFYVEVSDPLPVPEDMIFEFEEDVIEEHLPRRYWRQRTYDIYTGTGWRTGTVERVNMVPGLAWAVLDYPFTPVTQTLFLVADMGGLVLAVNEPLLVDHEYDVLLRGEADLAAMTTHGDTYTVVSGVPSASGSELARAEQAYPDWVAEKYLDLPDVPERVSQLAQEIVAQAGATTRYDKARAIEQYLRRMEYDLDLEPPPAGTDIVDYFLYTANRGYCDYSATAMTVMLRSVGVAARYASGFAPGSFDLGRYAWEVRENNAHAWSEVYFPGYGWIEFEPTPTQRTFARADTADLPSVARPAPEPLMPERQPIPMFWRWAIGVILALVFVIVWPPRWFVQRARDPRQTMLGVYAKLVRRGRLLGVVPHGGQTPSEYLAQLAHAVESRHDYEGQAAQEIWVIAMNYQYARYSLELISREDSDQVEAAWRGLRPRLRQVAWRGFFRSTKTAA